MTVTRGLKLLSHCHGRPPDLAFVRPHGNNEETWSIKAAAASERFN